ncbi:IS1634 family transposase [Dietzia sp. B32]|uniref:IS1634 family transposase n=1 Tax=Dietzia sp. B32 TaxID=2915130 RepID=UPI0021ADB0EF|nr:IS1634 family transposase [Dietzia sp. B32]UVE94400.1 IS1634 family transposase [Dietzia sp. B32]
MSPFVRKVKTSSGATAVQIVEKIRGQRKILEHIGSAHTEGELAALIAVARGKITAGQQPLELGLETEAQVRSGGDAVVRRHSSELLWQTLTSTFDALGFNAVADETFKALVCARLIEPTSKLDTPRVLDDIGVDAPHLSSIKRALARCVERDYRTALATACWEHVTSAGGPGVALVLYDLTTLYFEAEKEDSLRKVGMGKERRVDPQITVGLLVARDGFPLDIHVFEGNRAETKTLIPVITAFQQRHQISDMVVVADAGMLSAANLNALEDAGLSFIVASRTSKAPKELEDHFGRRGNAIDDGEVVELIRPMGQGRDRRDRRVVWHYKWQRAQRDRRTLNAQIDRAQRVADRSEPLKKQRFVKVTGQTVALDEASIERARQSAGYKGYVTNIDSSVMDGHAVVAAYHDLWRVEQSFRMAKSDLKARPIFSRTRDSIEAHLTIVFAALAIARHLQNRTGTSIKKIVRTLRRIHTVVIDVDGHKLTARTPLDDDSQAILTAIAAGH